MEYIEMDGSSRNRVRISPSSPVALRFLLDGAHNPAGVSFLVQTLKNQFSYQRLLVVWASMADKDYRDMLREMEKVADVLLLTRPESERSALPADLAGVLVQPLSAEVQLFDSVADALDSVFGQATPADLVVVAGSLYLVGEFRKLLVGEVVG